ncbi:MAG: hypothetical protein ACTHN0_18280 [Aquihabitans sp.]
MRVGIADHLGWAVVVAAGPDPRVADRRRIGLVAPDLSAAPIHYDRGQSDDAAIEALLAEVRASITQTAGAELDALAAALPARIESVHLRAWPSDFPTDLATLRRAPWEARADAVMYRTALADLATDRGWAVAVYDAKHVEAEAAALLGDAAEAVLHGPRQELGAPWAKDHRQALAATIVGR